MNREIKFRAYWKNVNQMRHFVPGHFVDTKDGWAMSFVLEDSFKNIYLGSAEIMQSTGLKDNNGKEIYEGDIISYRFKTKTSNDQFKSHVFFDEYMWLTEEHSINRINDVEVIGNIYEHPYLLNNAQEVQGSDTTEAK